MTDHDAEARYRANLQGEVDSAGLYRALADAETDERLKQVYGRLAAVEEAHAEFWRKQLDRIGARVGRLQLGWRDAFSNYRCATPIDFSGFRERLAPSAGWR